MKWLLKNVKIVPMNGDVAPFDGWIGVEKDRFVYIGKVAPNDLDSYDRIIDGQGKLAMPGLINTHGHAAMSLLRGYGDDLPLQTWLEEKMWPNEAKFTADQVRWGTSLAILEMIKTGTTTFADMYDYMDTVAEVVSSSGIRASLTRGVIGLCPEDEAKRKLLEARAFAKTWNGQADGRITTMMAPHSAYTCPPWYIEQIVEAAHELDLPIHIHLSETAREVADNVKQYGERPVKHLEKLGVFARPTLVAHAVHVTEEEMDILKQYDVHVSHNPGSNLKLASGVAPIVTMLEKGIGVSLGTDSAASNNNVDLFKEMRLAALIHKGVTGNPLAITARTALALATTGGAAALRLANVGVIGVGFKADMILVDLHAPHFYPRHDLLSHLVYAASGEDVSDVCVNGQWIVESRSCLTLDEERIKYEADRSIGEILPNP